MEDFTYWTVSCPTEGCPGHWDFGEDRHGMMCDGCDLRDLHPIPMSELYNLEKLYGLYAASAPADA